MMKALALIARFEHPTTARRFWSKVDHRGPVPELRPEIGQCWLWTAAKNERGYGRFGLGWGVVLYAHRWSYRRTVGPIPEGREVDHLCGNKSCVRPAHLEAVYHNVNCYRSYIDRTRAEAA